VAERYVAAYNDRDLEAMLVLQDEHVVSYPSRLFGQRCLSGHAGVREWCRTMVASGRWYQVVVHDVRLLGSDRLAVIGEIRDGGKLLSPWGVVVRVRNGLIAESRSYLSDAELLADVGVLDDRRSA
jgi:hypothetical protein